MAIMLNGGKILIGPNGTPAIDPNCCCGSIPACTCCPHVDELCRNGCLLDAVVTGAVSGSGTLVVSQFCTWEGNPTLTSNCGGIALALITGCGTNIIGNQCTGLVAGWTIDPAILPCNVVPDDSRGAQSNGWYSFNCNPFELIYHFKTVGAGCPCGDGTAITITITEHPGCR